MHKILIADDDPILSRILVKHLKKVEDSIEVITVKDGKEAIHILQRERISLLVTDIQMPILDGLELLAYVHENHPVVPCFVMTAYETPEIEDELAQDIVHFFRKPLEIDQFSQAILDTLKKDIPRGSLYGISVVRFLQMIEMENKTCIFEVQPPNKEKGLFYFEKGVLCDAEYGDIRGEAAALKIITTEKAKFRFRDLPQKKVTKWIKKDLKSLIKEAVQREIGLPPAKPSG